MATHTKTADATDWPAAPAGRQVVLHARVVTETGGGPDKTIINSAPYLNAAGDGADPAPNADRAGEDPRAPGDDSGGDPGARASPPASAPYRNWASNAEQAGEDTRAPGGGSGVDPGARASPPASGPYWMAAAYMRPPGDPGFAALQRRAVQVDCPLIGVDDRGPLDRTVFRQLLRLCRHLEVRIWHGHDYKSNLFGLLLRPFWKMKLVTTVHGWVKETKRTPLYYAVDRWCLPRYHHVMSVSEDLHQRVLELGVRPERATLIPNGIDERLYARRGDPGDPGNPGGPRGPGWPGGAPMRARLGTPAGRLVIGGMGRLSAEKAFGNLIHAVGHLAAAGQDVELWIGGEGDHRGELEALVGRLGLAGRVRLLGYVEDNIEFYQALDVFVLSSLREGLPNVVLEAMSMEVPVVCTRVAGVPQLIRDGENGLLCPVGDVAALTQALGRAVADNALRQALARQGRQTIVTQCSFAQRMARERAVYDQVLAP